MWLFLRIVCFAYYTNTFQVRWIQHTIQYNSIVEGVILMSREAKYVLYSCDMCVISSTCGSMAYIYTSWIPGFARDPLSRSLSPSLSRPSLPSLLFVPAFYPPSLGLPGFAQDNCIPEILFKPWSLVTLKFSPLTPPPVGWGGVGVTCFGYFSAELFLFIDFLGSSWNFPHFWNFDPPTPPPPRDAGPPGVGWVKFVLLIFWTFMGLTDTGWLKQSQYKYKPGILELSQC